MKRLLAVICCFACALSFCACQKDDKKSQTAIISRQESNRKVFKYDEISQLKIGFVYIGEIDNNGFNQCMDKARIKLTEKGYNCVYSEKIPDNELCEKEIIRLIEEEKANVIVMTSYNYMTYAKKVASVHPDVAFLQYSEEKSTENIGTFSYCNFEIKYLLGIAAGKKAVETGDKNIGYVAPVNTPFSYRDINAFALGVRSVCGDAKLYVKWTNSWGNVQLESDAANLLINKYNCKIMCYGTYNCVIPQICQEKGVYVLGNSMVAKEVAPDYCIAVGYPDFDEFITVEIEKFVNNGWSAKNNIISLTKNGSFTCIDVPKNSAENTAIAIEHMKNKIKNNELKIFGGPVEDNKGIVRAAEGETLSKSEIYTMKWLVEGVTEV